MEPICFGTTAKTAGEAERTNSPAITWAATACVDAIRAYIVVFSSIVLPPELVPSPLSVTVTDKVLSVHVYRRMFATQIGQQQRLLSTKQPSQLDSPGSFKGFPRPSNQITHRRLDTRSSELVRQNSSSFVEFFRKYEKT